MKLMDETEQIQRTVADRIKMRRQALDLSQADLAKMLQNQGVKIHQSAITKIESGERKLELSLAMQIAKALDMNWNEFFVQDKSLSEDALFRQIAETSSKLASVVQHIEEAHDYWGLFADFDLRNLHNEIYERIRSESLPRVGAFEEIASLTASAERRVETINEAITDELQELKEEAFRLRHLTEKVRNDDLT